MARLWVGFSVGGALLFIGLAFWLGKDSSLSSQQSHGVVERLVGTLSVRNQKNQNFVQVDSRPLINGQSLMTDEDGEARLTFNSGDRLRLLSQSQAFFEITDGQYRIIIEQGDIEWEGDSRSHGTIRFAGGVEISAHQWNERKKSMGRPFVKNETAVKNKALGPSVSEVEARFQKAQPEFLRCYSEVLKSNPLAKGEGQLNFSIEPSGKLAHVQFQSQSLTSKELANCLIRVAERIEFPRFDGEAIQTFYPFLFE